RNVTGLVDLLGEHVDLTGAYLGRRRLVDEDVPAARRVRVVGDDRDPALHRGVQRGTQRRRVGGRDDERVRALADRGLDGRDLRGRGGGGAAGLGAGLAERLERGDRAARLRAVGRGEVVVPEVLRDHEYLEAGLQPAGGRGRGRGCRARGRRRARRRARARGTAGREQDRRHNEG